MNHDTDHNEKLIDRIADEIRREGDDIDPRVESEALDRVWERIADGAAGSGHGAVLTCDDIQALLPAYVGSDLKPDRALLVEDHSRSCLVCRRSLERLRRGEPAPVAASAEASPGAPSKGWRWGLAAAVILAVGVVNALLLWNGLPVGGSDAVATVVQGTVFGLEGDDGVRLETGAEIPYGQEILTPRGRGALVTLADGSAVELRERSRLAVSRTRGGTTIDLEGGNIIVEAADQRDGHLYVATGDCLVSVTGTVFAVNHGTRGSRISVFEGGVDVDQGGRGRSLSPGEQLTTRASLSAVPLEEEIDWSVNQERHLALLQELVGLNEEMRSLPRPGLRYEPTLLDRLPETTVVYGAVPNLSESLGEMIRRLEDRISQNPVLAEWSTEESWADLGILLERLATVGGALGEEIVATAWLDAELEMAPPAIVAPVPDTGALRARLEEELAGLEGELGGAGEHVLLVDDPFASDLPKDALLIWIGDDIVVAAPGAEALGRLADSLGNGSGELVNPDFSATIRDRYADGVESLLAVDLATLVATSDDPEQVARLDRMGLGDVRHLVIEQWVEDEKTRRQAVLSFFDERRGIASWLAEPAPMGTLSFMSPDTSTVAAFVVKDPALLFADVMSVLTDEERSEVEADLATVESEHGWDLEEDFIAPLGGEIAIGLDGPLAPTPAWKVVVEVYDPQRLQHGIEQAAADLATRLAQEGDGTLEIVEASNGGVRMWVVERVRPDGVRTEVYYTYADGYLVATPSAALLDRALDYRKSEYSLLSSERLRGLVPTDAEVNFSALWYQDFSSVMGPLADMAGSIEDLPPELRAAVEEVGAGIGPTLVFAYGEADRIRVSSTSAHNPLGLVNLFLMQGLSGLDMMSGAVGAGP